MTREEVQRSYDELEGDLPIGRQMSLEDYREVERRVVDFACSLVSQAYEEALLILDRRSRIAADGDVDTGGAMSAELDEAYVEIRALAESLKT